MIATYLHIHRYTNTTVENVLCTLFELGETKSSALKYKKK